MKKLILNGSPRQGNTVAAINAFMGGEDKDFEIINLKAKKIAPCKACLFCKNEGNCIDKDDTNEVRIRLKRLISSCLQHLYTGGALQLSSSLQ